MYDYHLQHRHLHLRLLRLVQQLHIPQLVHTVRPLALVLFTLPRRTDFAGLQVLTTSFSKGNVSLLFSYILTE
jgi:hypothetical protein